MGLQAHAENLHAQSFQRASQPGHLQVSAKAQSLATHAQSLEAQAEAQNLQAQAHVHAHAHAEAQAQAQHLAAQAQAHAQAQAQANAHASHLKSAASFGEQTHLTSMSSSMGGFPFLYAAASCPFSPAVPLSSNGVFLSMPEGCFMSFMHIYECSKMLVSPKRLGVYMVVQGKGRHRISTGN